MEYVVDYLAYIILFLNITILAYAGTKLVQKFFSTPIDKYVERFEQVIDARYREIALLTALIATIGSLFLSNVLGWTPCKLCWFQRIFMYPLVLILGVSLFFDDRNVSDYLIPMTVIGGGIAVYHYFVQILATIQTTCSGSGPSCSTKFTFYFDYITIPIMALTAFVIVFILAYRNWR